MRSAIYVVTLPWYVTLLAGSVNQSKEHTVFVVAQMRN